MKPTAVFLSAVVLLAGARAARRRLACRRYIAWRIRREALEHSARIMKTLHMLTDVYGPRLTRARRETYEGAGRRVGVRPDQTWGMANTHLEPWNFGHPGMAEAERFSAFLVSPVKDSLVGEVLAWTPSTNGPVKAATVELTPPDRPSA